LPAAAVLFDLGGVLLPFDRERRVRAMVERLGVTPEAARALMAGELPLRIDLGEADEFDLARAFSDLCGRPVDVTEACELSLSVFERPNLEAWAMAQALGERVIVGGFSDNPGWVRRAMPQGVRLDPLFLSCEIKAIKPSPAAFAAVEAALPLAPGAILFIDDTAANVVAARGRGWDAIVFTDNAGLRRDLCERGLL
jgi:FMN phosphatase YigB (HAD superfamily)